MLSPPPLPKEADELINGVRRIIVRPCDGQFVDRANRLDALLGGQFVQGVAASESPRPPALIVCVSWLHA